KINRLVFHLWRRPIGGGPPQQLTFTETGDQPLVRWSPDSKTLLFGRDGQFMLMPADGGEARVLTKHATSVTSPTWSPDGTAVYFTAAEPRTSEERERDRVRDDVYAFDENYKLRQLWKIVVATGGETQITTGPTTVNEYRLSLDGRRIAVQRAPTPNDEDAIRGELWVMDASGENARALTRNAIEERGIDISPDGSQLLFLADTNDRFEPYYPTTLFVVPAAGGAPRALLSDFRYAIDQALWAPDGRSIIASANMGLHSELFEIDAQSGRPRQLTDGQHFVPPGWSIAAGARTIVCQLDEPTRFGEAWTLALAESATLTRATGVFDAVERDMALPRQEKVEWKGADGAPIEGILFYPIGYEAGRRYPLVVQLHAGPMESDKFGAGPGLLLNYFPVLTAKGYAVLRPNYRGSAGYGAAFLRDVNNGYFHNMAPDVLAGVDHLVQTGVADPNRLVVMGVSAGGTLTNKLVTMTDRFKAASASAGVADWTSLWGQTDFTGFRITYFGGTPWQKNAPVDQFWAGSPLKDVANVKTPTLLFAGDSDARVPMAQSLEMFRALKSHNVPTHLYIGPREGHLWADPRHLLFKANAELEWFAKYVGGGGYVWEKAPDPAATRPGS
ncbi:MAG TPA: S9 family peptidase, partial [Vicinamibacterales bacterium]|nr:S9 family peptidase [Vicinamibacterales bacterium]